MSAIRASRDLRWKRAAQRKRPPTFTPWDDRHQRIVSMWIGGMDFEAMAAYMNTTRGALVRTAHTIGLPHRTTGAMDRNLWPSVVAWARAGKTPEEIADGLGFIGKARRIALGRN